MNEEKIILEVAEIILGWKISYVNGDYFTDFKKIPRLYDPDNRVYYRIGERKKDPRYDPPQFDPINWSCHWMLIVEKMKNYLFNLSKNGNTYKVYFSEIIYDDYNGMCTHAISVRPGMAVCLAALRAKKMELLNV